MSMEPDGTSRGVAASKLDMDPLEYSFGNGVDAPTTWTSPADLCVGAGGSIDAVRLDFDGDGLLDDAMWDFGGDGVADHSVLDFGDGDEASFFTDPSGEGTWSQEVPRPVAVAYPSPPSQPWADHDASTFPVHEVRTVSAEPGGSVAAVLEVEPVVLSTGAVSRPSLVVESASSTVHGDGEQTGCVDSGPCQCQAH